jgi:hypothetical protein
MRGEDRTGYTGPAFVHAVVFAITVVALDIAARRHGKVHPSVFASHFGIETGVVFYIHDFRFLNVLHVKVPYGRRILLERNNRIGYGVEQLLGAAVPHMDDSRPTHAVVNRKADSDQRFLHFPCDFVALAVAD